MVDPPMVGVWGQDPSVPGVGLEPTCPEGLGGLSPLRLPVPPSGRERPDGSAQATRRSAGSSSSWASAATASHSRVRNREASMLSSRLATTTPSIMSARTATQVRSRSRTDTTTPVGRRRMDRSRPTVRGGLRKLGATNPSRRATCPRVRAAAANLSDVASMAMSIPTPCDSARRCRRRSVGSPA